MENCSDDLQMDPLKRPFRIISDQYGSPPPFLFCVPFWVFHSSYPKKKKEAKTQNKQKKKEKEKTERKKIVHRVKITFVKQAKAFKRNEIHLLLLLL